MVLQMDVRISCTDKVTNMKVGECEGKTFVKKGYTKKKVNKIGHVLCHEEFCNPTLKAK